MTRFKSLAALAVIWYALLPTAIAQPTQPWRWLQTLSGPGREIYSTVRLGPAGTLLTGAIFSDTATVSGLPPFRSTSILQGGINAVWQQHTASGQSLAAHVQGCESLSGVECVALDAMGNRYVATTYRDFDLTLTPTVILAAAGGTDGCLAKYDPSGTLLWARAIKGPSNDDIRSIALDSAGNCYITGSYCLTAQFDSLAVPGYFPLSTVGPDVATPDGYVAKFSSTGHLRWVRTTIGPEGEQGGRISIAPNGDCLVSGLADPTTVGAPGVTYTGHYLARYSWKGVARWVRPLCAVGQSVTILGLVATLDGGGYFTGRFGGVGTYQALSLIPGDTLRVGAFGASNAVVARFDSTGTVLWTRALHSISWVYGADLALIPGGVAVVGAFRFNNFSPQPAFLTAPGYSFPVRGERDGFVATYDSVGGLHTLQPIGGSGVDQVNACCYNPARRELVVAGSFTDTLGVRLTPGTPAIRSAGEEDGFLMGIPVARIITGVPELAVLRDADTWDIWPNPAHAWLNIRRRGAPSAGVVSLTLCDVLGRTVRRASRAEPGLSTAGLAPGLYHLTAEEAGHRPHHGSVEIE